MSAGPARVATPAGGGGAPLRAAEWALLAVLGLVFVPAVLALESVWSRYDYYSHGYLVPVVALLLALREREVLATRPVQRSAAGLVGLCAMLGLYGLGVAVGRTELQGLSLVGAVAATVLWLRGPAWLRTLAFPVAYLVFMVPLPEPWLQPLILRLRLFVTEAAVAILHAVGLPVLREGNVITLPGGESLFVADACSGVTSLVTLLPLAVLVAWLVERSGWGRAVIVLSVVPIALLFNLLRVLLTVAGAARFGVARVTAESLHEAAGLAIYVVGCLALLGVAAAVRRVRTP